MCQNNGRFQGMNHIKYTVFSTRLSGESLTSIGNTIINFYVQKYIFHKLNVGATILPNGDDSLTGLTVQIPIDTIVDEFNRFGLKVEAKYTKIIGATFLSATILPSQDGYQLVRDPVKALVKLPWCLDKRQLHAKRIQQYLHAKLCSFEYEYQMFSTFKRYCTKLRQAYNLPKFEIKDIKTYPYMSYNFKQQLSLGQLKSVKEDPILTIHIQNQWTLNWAVLDSYQPA